MKKPNVRQASDDYSKSHHNAKLLPYMVQLTSLVMLLSLGKLANALKNEENPQYAALCFAAMAKYVL